MTLGEHKDQPTHMLSLTGGWYGDIILYSGPNVESNPLAVVKYGNKMGTYDHIIMPPSQPDKGLLKEDLRCHMNGWNVKYTFVAPVGANGNPEKFEWRSSKSSEVKELDEYSRGWKLVRLNANDEVVAVWSHPKIRMNMSKSASFQFVGSGLSGELGDVFATMAVISFARQYQKEIQASINAGAAA